MVDETIKIKIESETSEFYVECKNTDKVEKIIDIVMYRWGNDDNLTLRHESVLMESDKKLAAYNVKDGSVINVKYYAELP